MTLNDLTEEMAAVILEWFHRKAGDGAKWFDKMEAVARKIEGVKDENPAPHKTMD